MSPPTSASPTAAILREAVAAAAGGNTGHARQLATDALEKGGDPAPLHAFLGMLAARAGDRDRAVEHLTIARRERPDDVTIACNLIAMLIELGRLEDALDIAYADAAQNDRSARLWRYRGFAAQSLGRFDEAAEAYERVIALVPDDAASWNNLGNARSALNDLEGAVEALRRSVVLDPLSPPMRLNLAEALFACGAFDDGEATLRTAAEEFPDDPHPWMALHPWLNRAERHDEALEALRQALARAPDDAAIHQALGVAFGERHQLEDAERHYRRALALAPGDAIPYLGLAIQYEHSNREEEFAPLAALAAQNDVEAGVQAFIQALEHRRAGRFAEGLAVLVGISDAIEPARIAHLRGLILDRLGRTDEAFGAFRQTNALHIAGPEQPLPLAARYREQLRQDIDALTPDFISLKSEGGDATDPVFLVGFPRSGTTLLDTLLMGHPRVTVMEEQRALNHVDAELGGQAALAALDTAGVAAARARYFEEVRAVSPFDGSTLLIDKSPLFLTKVPLITRLFPKARFILALRHPCDVLLSCFMSNFRLNASMANFLRLEDAAALYDIVFTHWTLSTELLSPNVHVIRYEDLIDDVSSAIRPLFDFLGLEWHAAVLDHQRTARDRGLITTASYAQVVEPIYRRAAGRWRRYAEHLQPVMPVLRPWIDRFGYDV